MGTPQDQCQNVDPEGWEGALLEPVDVSKLENDALFVISQVQNRGKLVSI